MSETLNPALQFSGTHVTPIHGPVQGDPATLMNFVARVHTQDVTQNVFSAYLDYSTDLANAQLKFNKAVQAAVAKAKG
jgi:hypothetical protein